MNSSIPLRDAPRRYWWQRLAEKLDAEDRDRQEWISDVKKRLGLVTIDDNPAGPGWHYEGMSEVFIAWQPAPADTVFAQGAFDGEVGSTTPVVLPGGRQVEGKIRSAVVAEDGSGVKMIVEVPAGTIPGA